MRTERDTLGEVLVPDDALYGAQTQRAVENYPVSGLREHPVFIRTFIQLKRAAALANRELEAMDGETADAIVRACDELLANFEKYRGEFVVDVFQAGAGTSFNMNVNEVIATLAGKNIHPNDHVNMSQSTNDVFPTAIRIATLLLLDELFAHLDALSSAFLMKGDEFKDVIKSGRTHLQDAVPITLGQEFNAYGEAVARATRALAGAAIDLRTLGIGGTAAGTGINTPLGYRFAVVRHLNEMTGLELESADDLREAMQSQFPVVAVSAALRSLALELTRITNDLRLLASGPQTGLAEIILPAVQPGSSIMPGKVNPSMLECMNQIL
ncbi:MAG TPA: lyase family protein, partial [Thermoanaerobaculia bacterium]|nr:lyase family protein [Thermoanaerobaculia bacterium]